MHQTFVRYPFIGLGGGRKSFELPCIVKNNKFLKNQKLSTQSYWCLLHRLGVDLLP